MEMHTHLYICKVKVISSSSMLCMPITIKCMYVYNHQGEHLICNLMCTLHTTSKMRTPLKKQVKQKQLTSIAIQACRYKNFRLI